jgi:Protein of unknown function (DUF1566)
MKCIKPLLIGGTLMATGVGTAFAQRFIDNGNGTISDRDTGLMWEQKTGTVDRGHDCPGHPKCADVHDVNNRYRWSRSGKAPDGGAFYRFLGTLNAGESEDAMTITSCFANHCDWRLPSIVELSGIRVRSASPAIDPIFGPTQDYYWSATGNAGFESWVWGVSFNQLGPSGATRMKDGREFVRAVRGLQ